MNVFQKNINLLIIILIGLISYIFMISIYKSFTRFEVSERTYSIETGKTETGKNTKGTITGTILNKQPTVLSGTKDRESKVTTKEGIKPVLGSVYAGYEGDSEYERARNQIIKLGLSYEIAEHITREAYTNTDNPKQFIKNIIGVSNSESSIFQHCSKNNCFGVMQRLSDGSYTLRSYTTIQESISARRELYVRNARGNRTTAQARLNGNYCTSGGCEGPNSNRAKNYNYAINKLNI